MDKIKETREMFENRLLKNGFDEEAKMKIMFAYDLAKAAHTQQLRHDRVTRYFEHVRRTALVLLDEAEIRDADQICAMLLHDTVEDSSIFANMKVMKKSDVVAVAEYRIGKSLGEKVSRLVIALTKFDPPSLESYRILSEQEPEAVILKMADRLDNLRDCMTKPKKNQSSIDFIEKYVKETRNVYLPVWHEVSSASELSAQFVEKIEKQLQILEHEFLARFHAYLVAYNYKDGSWNHDQAEFIFENKERAIEKANSLRNQGSDTYKSWGPLEIEIGNTEIEELRNHGVIKLLDSEIRYKSLYEKE